MKWTKFGVILQADEENIAIERVHLNPEAASEIFRGKYLDGSKVDFSDRITKPQRQRGYDAQTLWELAAVGEPETTLQKYLRLKVYKLRIKKVMYIGIFMQYFNIIFILSSVNSKN